MKHKNLSDVHVTNQEQFHRDTKPVKVREGRSLTESKQKLLQMWEKEASAVLVLVQRQTGSVLVVWVNSSLS